MGSFGVLIVWNSVYMRTGARVSLEREHITSSATALVAPNGSKEGFRKCSEAAIEKLISR